jgi:hypothetical protein
MALPGAQQRAEASGSLPSKYTQEFTQMTSMSQGRHGVEFTKARRLFVMFQTRKSWHVKMLASKRHLLSLSAEAAQQLIQMRHVPNMMYMST